MCRTDGEESVTSEGNTGCFPRNLMDNRDDLSSGSAYSDASHDDDSTGDGVHVAIVKLLGGGGGDGLQSL